MGLKGFELVPFGSRASGLDIKSSDLDLLIIVQNTNTDAEDLARLAYNLFQQRPDIYRNLELKLGKRLPIVTFDHISGWHSDPTFSGFSSIQNSEVIGFLLNIDQRAANLAKLVKYWSKLHNLNGSVMLSTYCHYLQVIFFLQIKHILPVIIDLQKGVSNIFNNYNVAFNRLEYTTSNNETLYQLLGMVIMVVLVGSGHCLDTSRLRDVGDFDSQINYVLESISLSPEDMENITKVYEDMEKLMKNIWPECKIEPFGATAEGLGMKSSDVDCFIILPNTTSISPEQCIEMARSYLETKQNIFTDIKTELEPLLSCCHTSANRSVHLLNTGLSYQRDTKLIHFYMNLDKRALDLAIFIKHWAKEQRVIAKDLIRSFSMTMTVIFYLQQRNILPSVRQLQKKAVSVVVDYWETGINNMEYRSDNNETLYQLLGGYFEYYSTFDFDEYIVAPYAGRAVKRDLFANVDDVPDDYHLYKHNVRENITAPLKLNTTICIQDPFAHNANSAELVCPQFAEKIILQYKSAARLYRQTSSEDFLTAILGDNLLKRLLGKESTC